MGLHKLEEFINLEGLIMADNDDIMDLDGNDEVEVEHVMRPMPRYTNIRQRYHAMNMLNRMHADELSSQLNRIKNFPFGHLYVCRRGP